MPDALSDKVQARVAGAEALYHRLILVAAPEFRRYSRTARGDVVVVCPDASGR